MTTTTAPSLKQPLDMLTVCHEQIEAHLGTLEGLLADLQREGCDAQSRRTAASLVRYFDTSGELHHKDEDDDLFPLVRVRAAAHGRLAVAAVIDELEREHATMHAQWVRLRPLLLAVAEGDVNLDRDHVERFVWLYRRHMEREAAVVLPFAREALEASELAALGDRMAARRGVLVEAAGIEPASVNPTQSGLHA